jgi:hypothetical protein
MIMPPPQVPHRSSPENGAERPEILLERRPASRLCVRLGHSPGSTPSARFSPARRSSRKPRRFVARPSEPRGRLLWSAPRADHVHARGTEAAALLSGRGSGNRGPISGVAGGGRRAMLLVALFLLTLSRQPRALMHAADRSHPRARASPPKEPCSDRKLTPHFRHADRGFPRCPRRPIVAHYVLKSDKHAIIQEIDGECFPRCPMRNCQIVCFSPPRCKVHCVGAAATDETFQRPLFVVQV